MMLRKFGDGRESRIRESLSSLGIEVGDSPEGFARGSLARQWYDEQVIPKLRDLEFWGLKEVYLTDAEQLIRHYSPDQILLLWRDPRDVALSFLELMNRSLMSYADRRTLKDEAWAMECLRESAETLGQLAADHPSRIIRYEQLIESSEHQQEILKYVGLPEFGKSQIAMVEDSLGIRSPEVQRHQQRLSNRSIGRWGKEPPGWRRTFASVCQSAMEPYSVDIGYPRSPFATDKVCATPSEPSATRVSDPAYEPAQEFDFAYARRRARRLASQRLSPGSSVLDVGASTAALCFMADQAKVTAIDDGSPGKRVLSKPWREGVFPSLGAFDTATFLFTLEYVADPLRLVRGLLQRGIRIMISYHCLDDLPIERRHLLQFESHLSRQQWASFAGDVGADISCEWTFDGFQSLICLSP